MWEISFQKSKVCGNNTVDSSLMAALKSIVLLNCDRPKLPSEHNCCSSDSQLPFMYVYVIEKP